MKASSSLQSNRKASPGRNGSGTKVPRLAVCSSRWRPARHSRAKAATRLQEPVKPSATGAACNGFSVRRCFRPSPASVFSRPASVSANGSSLPGRAGVANRGSTAPDYGYFLTVLRDSPVRRAIARSGSCSRSARRRTTFNSPTWIRPLPPAHRPRGRVAWVKSQ
jgi:hypothetical protein